MQHVTRRSAQDIHEWEGSFRGQPASYRMTSVIGHVYSLDFPKVDNIIIMNDNSNCSL